MSEDQSTYAAGSTATPSLHGDNVELVAPVIAASVPETASLDSEIKAAQERLNKLIEQKAAAKNARRDEAKAEFEKLNADHKAALEALATKFEFKTVQQLVNFVGGKTGKPGRPKKTAPAATTTSSEPKKGPGRPKGKAKPKTKAVAKKPAKSAKKSAPEGEATGKRGRKSDWTPAHDEQLKKLHAEGKTAKQIAKIMGVSEGQIAKKKKALGLTNSRK